MGELMQVDYREHPAYPDRAGIEKVGRFPPFCSSYAAIGFRVAHYQNSFCPVQKFSGYFGYDTVGFIYPINIFEPVVGAQQEIM